MPVGRQIFPARQVDGDALLAGVGQGLIHHTLHKAQGLKLGSGGQPLQHQIQIRVALKGAGLQRRTKQPRSLHYRPTLPQGLRGLGGCHQQPLPPFLQKPLLLGPAPLQVLVMEIDGTHGKTLRECASCWMFRGAVLQRHRPGALAIARGWRLVSFGRGFGRFEPSLWLLP